MPGSAHLRVPYRVGLAAPWGILFSSVMVAMSTTGNFVVFERQGQARGYRQSLTPPSDGQAPAPSPLDLQLVEIPAGRFVMGSPDSEKGRSEAEGPQHAVTLESFFLGRTLITQAQWREVAGWVEGPGERWGLDLEPEPSRFQPRSNPRVASWYGEFSLLPGETSSDQRPVEHVGWHGAMEFCHRLSQRTGRHYTLPSEAQWEYACRAGMSTPFHFGATISSELANYDGRSTYANGPEVEVMNQTTPAGLFPANAWGLWDMHGNVWEWCLDHWHGSYDLGNRTAPADGSPWLDALVASVNEGDGKARDERPRVLRGGSWNLTAGSCRSAYRTPHHPANAGYSIGFRVCCMPRGRFSSALEPLGL